MTKIFTELSVLLVSLTVSSAHAAGVLGRASPFLPDETGNWSEFRTNEEEALLSDAGDDSSCVKRLPSNLRQLFFENFRYYVDHSKTKIGETEIARFAKVLGMAPHESSGASAAVTDMKYKGSHETLSHFYNTDNPGRAAPQALYSSTDSLNALFALKNVRWDQQTNFGLLQMSADRLASGGGMGDLAESMITNMKTLYLSHPEEVIDRCGTGRMFSDSAADLRVAFDEIQSCELGYKTKAQVQCFGRWATLCPAYNVTLALIAPAAYFATRDSAPLCSKTFRKILKTGRGDGGVQAIKTGGAKVATKPVTSRTPPPELPKMNKTPTSKFGTHVANTLAPAPAENTQPKPKPKAPVLRGGIEEVKATMTLDAPVVKNTVQKKRVFAPSKFGA